MKPSTVEAWVWVLLFGGLLVAVLGISAQRQGAAIGSALTIGGAVAAAIGVVLIFVRSRMRP